VSARIRPRVEYESSDGASQNNDGLMVKGRPERVSFESSWNKSTKLSISNNQKMSGGLKKGSGLPEFCFTEATFRTAEKMMIFRNNSKHTFNRLVNCHYMSNSR